MTALSETASGATLSAFVAAAPLALFAALTPPITDVWVTKDGSTTAMMVRHGEALATIVSVGAALVVSFETRSAMPLFLTLVVCGLIVGAYETILRKDVLS